MIKSYIITIKIFIAFWSIFKKVKNRFPILFSKKDWGEGGGVFLPKFLSDKAKHPGICPSFGGTVGKT